MLDLSAERHAGRLADGLAALRLAIDPSRQTALLRYLDLLARWNAVYNLTAVRDPNDMLGLHLLDSLSIVPLIDELGAKSILDVGSGGGLPAIPIAIARPLLHVDSVDAVSKKIAFQRQVKAELKLNVVVHHSRVEALTLPKKPDTIVSRAYAELGTMLRSVDGLADAAVDVIAMKAAEPRAELRDLPPGWQHVETRVLDVPFIGAERCAVVLRRVP